MQRSAGAPGLSMCLMVLLASHLALCVAQSPAVPDPVTADPAALVSAEPLPEQEDPSDAVVKAAHSSSSWSKWDNWVWHNGWYKSLSRATTAASKLPQMSTLLAAVNAAGVAEPLSDKGTTWTILAPTNDAFEDLLEALNMKAADLLKDKDLLKKVLSYHVIPAAALNSRQLQAQAYPTALQGASVTIKKRSSGSVRITGGTAGNRANVIVPNIRAGNSIIHLIDTVLLPGA